MAASPGLKALVDRIPDPDRRGTYACLTPQSRDALRELVVEILEGGRDNVVAIIEMLRERRVGQPVADVKAHYALHLLAVHVTGLGDEKVRAEVATAIASQLEANRPKGVKKYLIQELQVCGGREVAEALGKCLLDPDLCDDAARTLAAIEDDAAEVLLAAYPKVKGRSRLSIIKKLAILRCQEAADIFKRALEDPDPDIRIAGGWGISRIADASSADALLKAADEARGWLRINLSDAAMALAEALMAAGKKPEAIAIYRHMAATRTAPHEKHIRDAARRALVAT